MTKPTDTQTFARPALDTFWSFEENYRALKEAHAKSYAEAIGGHTKKDLIEMASSDDLGVDALRGPVSKRTREDAIKALTSHNWSATNTEMHEQRRVLSRAEDDESTCFTKVLDRDLEERVKTTTATVAEYAAKGDFDRMLRDTETAIAAQFALEQQAHVVYCITESGMTPVEAVRCVLRDVERSILTNTRFTNRSTSAAANLYSDMQHAAAASWVQDFRWSNLSSIGRY